MMFLFGVGTLPAMLATSLGADRLQAFLRRRGLKLVIALLLIASGTWTLYLTVAHGDHAGHGAAQPVDHSDMHHGMIVQPEQPDRGIG
jgi:sulfite exporter TauE/SafE